jgi:hypothetical protein
MIDATEPQEWRNYEDYVFKTLREKYPDHKFERNIRITGKTGAKRQVDIAIWGKVAGHDILAVVDCKYYSKKIDVKDVEMFIGMLDDLKADIGIMVTDNGYTETAKIRAEISRVRLDIVKYEEIDEYELEFYICDECSDEEHTGIVKWNYRNGLVGDINRVLDIGRCDRCMCVYVRCQKCSSITPIPEYLYGEEVECTGGCDLRFIISRSYDRKAIPTESIKVIRHRS